MSLNKISGHARVVQKILAFLDPDKIDQEILIEGSQQLAEKFPDLEFLSDELDLLDAQEALLQAALISKENESGPLPIHRLIQAAVIRRLSSEEKATTFNDVIRLFCWGFPDTFSEDLTISIRVERRARNVYPTLSISSRKKATTKSTLLIPKSTQKLYCAVPGICMNENAMT